MNTVCQDFRLSMTKDNLMRAFAGESQARNRYTFAAEAAHTAKMPMLERVLMFTAAQEKAHAEIFYDFLCDLSGEEIKVDGGYPINISDNLADLLKWARDNEFKEYREVYADFAKTAEKEGYANIAAKFALIAEIERCHGERFQKIVELLGNGKLFVNDEPLKWMCLNCGHIYLGTKVPDKCPVCAHGYGYFIRAEYAPYNFGEI